VGKGQRRIGGGGDAGSQSKRTGGGMGVDYTSQFKIEFPGRGTEEIGGAPKPMHQGRKAISITDTPSSFEWEGIGLGMYR